MEENTHRRVNRLGDIEVLDENGKLIETQYVKKNHKDKTKVRKTQPKKKGLHQVKGPSGKLVWVQDGVNPDDLPQTIWPYSRTLADQIIIEIVEGKTLKDISKLKGFPPLHTLYYWMRQYPEFEEAVDWAKKRRAEHYHDKVIEVAERTKKKSEVNVNKLKISAYKWAAQVGSPQDYGAQESRNNGATQINVQIDTGINRGEKD